MIKLHFIQSPDRDILTQFDVLWDSYFLSRLSQGDLVVNDPEWPSHGFRLIVDHDSLLLDARNFPFLCNGKKIIGKKPLKRGDKISLGQTTFVIDDFGLSEKTNEQRLRDRYQEVGESSPDTALLIDEMEEELMRIQLEENKLKEK